MNSVVEQLFIEALNELNIDEKSLYGMKMDDVFKLIVAEQRRIIKELRDE